ncbi:hypothetical protein RclHR1_17270002 [Rhizophagus clarus]|uniref:Uncharacterized protein n=1 Tax=Rhizophagus clarus TaxID=94130 RepID=A0A2Z6R056_9GLOM|nr:hypothetical protein RclHR1_17270002 [Rhizophagus clarus]
MILFLGRYDNDNLTNVSKYALKVVSPRRADAQITWYSISWKLNTTSISRFSWLRGHYTVVVPLRHVTVFQT